MEYTHLLYNDPVVGQQIYPGYFINILCSQYSLKYLVEIHSNTTYMKPVNRNSLKFLFFKIDR